MALHSGCEYKVCGNFISASLTLKKKEPTLFFHFCLSICTGSRGSLRTAALFSPQRSVCGFSTQPVFQIQWGFARCWSIFFSFFSPLKGQKKWEKKNKGHRIAAKRFKHFNHMYKFVIKIKRKETRHHCPHCSAYFFVCKIHTGKKKKERKKGTSSTISTRIQS